MELSIINWYKNLIDGLPMQFQIFINLFLLVLVVVIYAIFVWRFDFFISSRDILRLNLNKYNKSTHPVLVKVVAGLLYLLEYLIILPIVIFFSFMLFSFLLIIISSEVEADKAILIAAITVASVRMASYMPKYGEIVAGQIAKIIPFTLLVFSLTEPAFFNFERILSQIAKIPEIISLIWIYFFFIVALELILRVLAFSGGIFGAPKSAEEAGEKKE